MCVHEKVEKEIKWEILKKMGFLRKNRFLENIDFLLVEASDGCFGPGVEEQVGEEPLGEKP